MLSIAQNISFLWGSSEFAEKQKLQTLVFPEGILYNAKIRAVRTESVNALFACMPPQKWLLAGKKAIQRRITFYRLLCPGLDSNFFEYRSYLIVRYKRLINT